MMMTVVMLVMVLNKMDKMHELINKDLEEIKNRHSEINSTITEIKNTLLLLLLSRFSRVRLFATPHMAAHQAPPSLGFSRQNTVEGINSRISDAEERISELEDKMVEIISEEQNKVKKMKRAEDSLRDVWDHIERTCILIIRVPEE